MRTSLAGIHMDREIRFQFSRLNAIDVHAWRPMHLRWTQCSTFMRQMWAINFHATEIHSIVLIRMRIFCDAMHQVCLSRHVLLANVTFDTSVPPKGRRRAWVPVP